MLTHQWVDFLYREKSNDVLYIPIPKGESYKTQIKIRKLVPEIIKYSAGKQVLALLERTLNGLEKDFPELFQALKEKKEANGKKKRRGGRRKKQTEQELDAGSVQESFEASLRMKYSGRSGNPSER